MPPAASFVSVGGLICVCRGWRRWLNGTQWTLGVMNAFDRLPPWHSTGYYSRCSDPRGRYVYLQSKKSF